MPPIRSVIDDRYRQQLKARFGKPHEPSPNSFGFAPDHPQFRQYARTGASRFYGTLRGDKFGRVYVHSPENITIQELDSMRMDGQVRAGMMLLKLPIQRSRWTIVCPDKDIANFATEILKPQWASWIRQILLALDFGFVAAELLPEHRYNMEVTSTQAALGTNQTKKYPIAVGLRDVMLIDPLTLKLLAYNRSGQFAGFEQFTPELSMVPRQKAFHFANEMEFQELYGVARSKPCFPYWMFKRSQYEWANVGFEKNSIPIRKMRYPEGEVETGVDAQGNPMSVGNDQIALELGEDLDNNNVIALPSSRYDEKAMAMWDAEFMANPFNGKDILDYIDHLNAQILKALLIPELALNVGSSGSYDLAQEQIRFMLLGLEATMDQVGEAVNNQIIERIVRWNFGSNAPKAYLRFQPLADDVKEGLVNVLLETVGQGNPIPLKDGNQMIVDWQKVADDSGIPVDVLTSEEMALYEDARQRANPQPEPGTVPGQDGSEGGGDMPFGAPPSNASGGKQSRGWGSKGGASNTPQNMDHGGGDDGEIGLSEHDLDLSEWCVSSDGELHWKAA